MTRMGLYSSPGTSSSGLRDAVLGSQLRAARALAGVSAADLAKRANVSLNTVKRAEASIGPVSTTPANADAIVRALAALGVVLVPPDAAGGPGVRLMQHEARTSNSDQLDD